MTPTYHDSWLTIYGGDVRDVLPELAADSVDCIVTSPPYWGLRDYGTASWSGGDPDHEHVGARLLAPPPGSPKQASKRGSTNVYAGDCACGAERVDQQIGLEPTPDEYVANMVAVFRDLRRVLKPSGTCWLNLGSSFASSGGERAYGSSDGGVGRGPGTRRYRAGAGGTDPSQSPSPERAPSYGTDGRAPADSPGFDSAYSDLCDGCRGDSPSHRGRSADTGDQPSDASLPSPTDRDSEPRDSGQASPGASPLGVPASTSSQSSTPLPASCSHCGRCGACLSVLRSSWPDARACARKSWLNYTTFKPKDLVPIPWMVAMALQADGWYLRRDVIWSKSNPMPESVTDRPTSSHEYLFLLTKAARYYFDADAVRESVAEATIDRLAQNVAEQNGSTRQPGKTNGPMRAVGTTNGRNVRSVWTIATRPYPGAHFAVFPPELPERCIKAGSSEKGVCPECGAPWERVVEREAVEGRRDPGGVVGMADAGMYKGRAGRTTFTTTGWCPTCDGHYDPDYFESLQPEPAVVLDPFAGSGTTGMVANRLSRRAILIDLNPEYLKQQLTRNAQTPLGLTEGDAA